MFLGISIGPFGPLWLRRSHWFSRLPPVLSWFRRARLDLEPYSRIHLTHKVGNPNVQLHMIISNIGGRALKVKEITLKLERDGKDVASLPAQNYLPNPSEKNSVLFTGFPLKPGEEWAHIVNFLNYFDRDNEKKYRNAESQLREGIVAKRNRLENKDVIVEVDANLVSPFNEIFKEKFIWSPGEYKVTISLIASNSSANLSKAYRFTLFESDSHDLSQAQEAFKYGDGINWDSGKYLGVIVELKEA